VAQFTQFMQAPIFDADQHMDENAGLVDEAPSGKVFAGSPVRSRRPLDPHRDQYQGHRLHPEHDN
jgi:aspartyl/asparaginyl beta-hydroxylase (cupin superfamily)